MAVNGHCLFLQSTGNNTNKIRFFFCNHHKGRMFSNYLCSQSTNRFSCLDILQYKQCFLSSALVYANVSNRPECLKTCQKNWSQVKREKIRRKKRSLWRQESFINVWNNDPLNRRKSLQNPWSPTTTLQYTTPCTSVCKILEEISEKVCHQRGWLLRERFKCLFMYFASF